MTVFIRRTITTTTNGHSPMMQGHRPMGQMGCSHSVFGEHRSYGHEGHRSHGHEGHRPMGHNHRHNHGHNQIHGGHRPYGHAPQHPQMYPGLSNSNFFVKGAGIAQAIGGSPVNTAMGVVNNVVGGAVNAVKSVFKGW